MSSGRVKRRSQPSSRPPLRFGQVSLRVGVERVDVDALPSLKCAGWLPQDVCFESEWSAGLGSSVNRCRAMCLLIVQTRITPRRLPTPSLLIWTVVG